MSAERYREVTDEKECGNCGAKSEVRVSIDMLANMSAWRCPNCDEIQEA